MANTKKLETLYSVKTGTGTDGNKMSTTLQQDSNPVNQAWRALQKQKAAKPGDYQSQWQGQINDLMGQIQNRPAFRYDINADALWNQYKDQYVNLGQQAMMDTMGQAQAMTGGYGNSYAQTAGQQAYQGYLQGLTDKVPELYGMALNKYQMEGNDLMNRYGLLADQENLDYSRFQDAVNQYYADLDRLQGIYDNERNFQYNKEINDRDYAYQLQRDTVADEQWQTEWDEYVRRYNFENKLGEFAVETPSGGGEEEEKKGNSGTKTNQPKDTDQEAMDFVERMLDAAQSTRFDPERVIKGTNVLSEDQKKTAQNYLKELITSGYMK